MLVVVAIALVLDVVAKPEIHTGLVQEVVWLI